MRYYIEILSFPGTKVVFPAKSEILEVYVPNTLGQKKADEIAEEHCRKHGRTFVRAVVRG